MRDLLNQFPEFRLLNEKDNKKIRNFFNISSMQTSKLKLRYLRAPSFFTFLYYQSDEVFVIGGDKDEQSIKAIATMTLREGYIDGVKKRIAYLGDLRVVGGVKYSKRWQKLFGDILNHSQQMDDVKADIFLTAVMAGNEKASKALTNNLRSPYRYQKLCDYYMVSMVMPLRKITSLKNIEIRRAKQSDQEVLLDFLEKEYKKRPFGFTRDYIQRCLNTWDNFSIEHFIILKEAGLIKSVLATWNPSHAKKIIIESLPRSLKIVNSIISPFTKTGKIGQELKIQYLNFMIMDSKNDFKYFLEYLREEKVFKKFDLVAFGDFEPFNYRDVLKGIVTNLTPLELYQVQAKENQKTQNIALTAPPAFEISLV